jgi:thiosulfate reductase cytochrome b subunit
MSANEVSATAGPAEAGSILVHPLAVRVTHWINVVAMLVMIASGWRIYNASPIFPFKFPAEFTLGGWLGGALLWHFAAMWLLVVNGLAYVLHGLLSGRYRRDFFPLRVRSLVRELGGALRGKLAHEVGVYNTLQRAAYVGVVVLGLVLVASGLAIWKPVQFQAIGMLMGGYEGARIVHFFAMVGIVLFVLIHVVMVLVVPSTFLPMLTGRAKSSGSKP